MNVIHYQFDAKNIPSNQSDFATFRLIKIKIQTAISRSLTM
jgi:hypothetical protein